MAWFKVDDNFAFHPKAIGATNAALGLWVRAGSWCGANLTGGWLPAGMVGTLGGHKRDARKLVEVGLWVEVTDGYQFKDWDLYQPTKAQVEAERAAARARQAAYRDRQRNGVTVAVTDGVSDGVIDGSPSRPVPSRPEVPTELLPLHAVPAVNDDDKPSRQRPERPLPESWSPTAKHYELALERGIDIKACVEAFRLHAETHDRRARNWDAAFRTWLNKARPATPPPPVPRSSSPWDRAPRIGGAS